jgi:hypothetical protein
MSAKIYSGIEGIEEPEINFEDFKAYEKQCDDYIEKLRAVCKKRKPLTKAVGEVIRFGVADGYALYMVYDMKPLKLIHINTMDGYQFEHADLLTPEKIEELIERDKKLAELFGKKPF